MGQTAQALGMGSTLEFRDKSYTLSPWSFKIRAQYELYLEGRATQAVRRMQSLLSKQEYDDLMARVVRDISSGVYTFGSEVVEQSIHSLENLRYLTYLMMRVNHPEVLPELVREMFEELGPGVLIEKVNEANAEPEPGPNDSRPGSEPGP